MRALRRDDYRIELDRLPPDGSTLFIPANTSGLQRQRQAVFRLQDRPLPHHRVLLRLCEAPDRVHWSQCRPKAVSDWYLLGDARWSGVNGDVEPRIFGERDLVGMGGLVRALAVGTEKILLKTALGVFPEGSSGSPGADPGRLEVGRCSRGSFAPLGHGYRGAPRRRRGLFPPGTDVAGQGDSVAWCPGDDVAGRLQLDRPRRRG